MAASKSLALLTFLALEPGAHSREELATLLWGESAEEEARGAFRQMLKRLRDLLGEALHVDRHSVELRGPLACDVTTFLSALSDDPAEAVKLDVPNFLNGLTVRHSPAFDEWADAKRQTLLRRYQQALGALAREALAHWRWRDVVTWADRWLACDPLSDEAARLATEALYLSGDREGALRRFGEHRDRLAREAGSKPGPALLELGRRIETDVAAGARREVSDEWYAKGSFEATLVGRDEHWARLTKAWQAVARSKGRVVLIEGEAGVGKTRLAEEFLRWARTEGSTVLRGRGYDPQAGIPYGPIVEAMREALAAPGLAGTDPEWLTEAARLLPELRRRFPGLPEPPAPGGAADRWRLFEGLAQLVLAVSAEQPVVFFVDDLQWCDGETCALIHFLARRLEGSAVLLIGTMTLGELERDAPAARLCRALRTQSHATVVTPAPLTEEEVWHMIREMGRIQAPTGARRLAARIHEVTGGNPFYVIELLKTLFAQGLLAVDAETGEWVASQEADAAESGGFPMSRTVHDAIAERVERLAYELRDLLVTLAVAGLGCRTEFLSHVHGISRLHAAALCDALVERRLAVEDSGLYRCAHPVIAAVVREGLTASRRREVHRAVALSLELVTPPAEAAEFAGEIARHAERGGERAL
ncbi:MAG: ATP-binding protein, partial [Gemmatimonadales bacterium]